MDITELEKLDGGVLILGNKIRNTEPAGAGMAIGISARAGGGFMGWIWGKILSK